VEKNSQSLTRLINDLLDMSAILSGKMRIEKLPVSLNGAVGEAVETIRPAALKRGISLEMTLCQDEQEVMVNGDRTRLVQSFWNILANAVKFFSGERGSVRVTCEADEKEARVVIEDEGQGITPEFLPFVFERFRQADSSKTREHGGLGIGLALVKSFVEAHGGRVQAESGGVGLGSRFTVYLPRLHARVRSVGTVVPEMDAHAAPSAINVLVIEDSPDTLELLHKALKIYGYGSTLCESAEEALSVASSSSFDAIISDIGMPKIDGYELIRRLRLLPHLLDVPAIALSGYAAQKDIEAALAAGFDAHVAKPVDAAMLAAELEQLLLRRAERTNAEK
jgi:CheY-like chemotaxis protein